MLKVFLFLLLQLKNYIKRLKERGLDSEEVIAKRIEGAKLEMEKSSKFKYQIINNSLETALKNLLNIIFREKHG